MPAYNFNKNRDESVLGASDAEAAMPKGVTPKGATPPKVAKVKKLKSVGAAGARRALTS